MSYLDHQDTELLKCCTAHLLAKSIYLCCGIGFFFCLISNFSPSLKLSLSFASLVFYHLSSLLFYIKSASISQDISEADSLTSEPLKSFLCPTRHAALLGGMLLWKYLLPPGLTRAQWPFNCCRTLKKFPSTGLFVNINQAEGYKCQELLCSHNWC